MWNVVRLPDAEKPFVLITTQVVARGPGDPRRYESRLGLQVLLELSVYIREKRPDSDGCKAF